jgi:membrane associated rhomboid family serine protease
MSTAPAPGADSSWSFKRQVQVLGAVVAVFWLVVIVDWFLPDRLSLLHLGIHPRTAASLINIVTAPFVHSGFALVAANTLAFVPLGYVIMFRRPRPFVVVSLVSMAASGLGIWVFGSRDTIVVGASGVIFGYLGFLLMRGYFERSVPTFLVSLTVAILFGSAIWGLLPTQERVSWQGHLFGFLGGVLAAALLAPRHPASGPTRQPT